MPGKSPSTTLWWNAPADWSFSSAERQDEDEPARHPQRRRHRICFEKASIAQTPLGRIGQPGDIASQQQAEAHCRFWRAYSEKAGND